MQSQKPPQSVGQGLEGTGGRGRRREEQVEEIERAGTGVPFKKDSKARPPPSNQSQQQHKKINPNNNNNNNASNSGSNSKSQLKGKPASDTTSDGSGWTTATNTTPNPPNANLNDSNSNPQDVGGPRRGGGAGGGKELLHPPGQRQHHQHNRHQLRPGIGGGGTGSSSNIGASSSSSGGGGHPNSSTGGVGSLSPFHGPPEVGRMLGFTNLGGIGSGGSGFGGGGGMGGVTGAMALNLKFGVGWGGGGAGIGGSLDGVGVGTGIGGGVGGNYHSPNRGGGNSVGVGGGSSGEGLMGLGLGGVGVGDGGGTGWGRKLELDFEPEAVAIPSQKGWEEVLRGEWNWSWGGSSQNIRISNREKHKQREEIRAYLSTTYHHLSTPQFDLFYHNSFLPAISRLISLASHQPSSYTTSTTSSTTNLPNHHSHQLNSFPQPAPPSQVVPSPGVSARGFSLPLSRHTSLRKGPGLSGLGSPSPSFTNLTSGPAGGTTSHYDHTSPIPPAPPPPPPGSIAHPHADAFSHSDPFHPHPRPQAGLSTPHGLFILQPGLPPNPALTALLAVSSLLSVFTSSRDPALDSRIPALAGMVQKVLTIDGSAVGGGGGGGVNGGKSTVNGVSTASRAGTPTTNAGGGKGSWRSAGHAGSRTNSTAGLGTMDGRRHSMLGLEDGAGIGYDARGGWVDGGIGAIEVGGSGSGGKGGKRGAGFGAGDDMESEEAVREREGREVVEMAAKLFGKLARLGGSSMVEVATGQITNAIEWLQEQPGKKSLRYAATVLIREMTREAPQLLMSVATEVLDNLWYGLRDQSPTIRLSASKSLSSMLRLVTGSKRRLSSSSSTRTHHHSTSGYGCWAEGLRPHQYYEMVYEQVKASFEMKSIEGIHSGLLVVRELVWQCGSFMQPNYQDALRNVFSHTEHPNSLIRCTVMETLPVFAGDDPEAFSQEYLNPTVVWLKTQIQKGRDTPNAFLAFSEIVRNVKDDTSLLGQLPTFVKLMRQAMLANTMQKHLNKTTPEIRAIFECIATLASALPDNDMLHTHLPTLIRDVAAFELSTSMVKVFLMSSYLGTTLTSSNNNYGLTWKCELLAKLVRDLLIDIISLTLCGELFRPAGSTWVPAKANVPVAKKEHPKESIVLALKTLATFHWAREFIFQEFISDVLVSYLDHDDDTVRAVAAECCCDTMVDDGLIEKNSARVVEIERQVLSKVMGLAVADSEPSVRLAIMKTLWRCSALDRAIAQAEYIRSLLLALHDEVFQIREYALLLIGRLGPLNPACISAPIWETSRSLLEDLVSSPNLRVREESGLLLAILMGRFPELTKRSSLAVMDILLPKARDSNPAVAIAIMRVLGQLANLGGPETLPSRPKLMELIIDTLHSQASIGRRLAALQALGLLARGTVYVIEPYLEHEELLTMLTNTLLHEQDPDIKRETVKVMGILGAVDPQKLSVARLQTDSRLDGRDPPTLEPTDDDYYPKVAFNALLGILRDSNLANHHIMAVEAILFVFRALRLRCVPYLTDVLPAFDSAMRASPEAQLSFYFQSLGQLVSLIHIHIRHYLPRIVSICEDFWATASIRPHVVGLIESLGKGLKSYLREYVPTLLSIILSAFDGDAREPRQEETLIRVMDAIPHFGRNLDEWIAPAVTATVGLLSRADATKNLRKYAIQSIEKLSGSVNLSDFASQIIHPLIRMLQSGDAELQAAAIKALSKLASSMGQAFLVFEPTVSIMLSRCGLEDGSMERFSEVISDLKAIYPKPLLSKPKSFTKTEAEAMPLISDSSNTNLPVDSRHFQAILELSERAKNGDWKDWLKQLISQLLRASPSPSLRACARPAETYPPLAPDLLNAAFVSCWSSVSKPEQLALAGVIENALTSPAVPPDTVQALLNLAVFMERYMERVGVEAPRGSSAPPGKTSQNEALFIDFEVLGKSAQRCHAWAKALHYRELQCREQPHVHVMEELVRINSQLQHPDGAQGILKMVPDDHDMPVREELHEEVGRWEKALQGYEERAQRKPNAFDPAMGRLRCYNALGEWEKCQALTEEFWPRANLDERRRMAPLAAAAIAFGVMDDWGNYPKYISVLRRDSTDRAWLKAVFHVHRKEYTDASRQVSRAREGIMAELPTLLSESYSRAYPTLVRVQMLAEIEEIIAQRQGERWALSELWAKRLLGCSPDVDVWQRILKLRSGVYGPESSREIMLKYANLCRKSGQYTLASKALDSLVPVPRLASRDDPADVRYSRLKLLWKEPVRDRAGKVIEDDSRNRNAALDGLFGFIGELTHEIETLSVQELDQVGAGYIGRLKKILSRSYFKKGEWQANAIDVWTPDDVAPVLDSYTRALKLDAWWGKAWHEYALTHAAIITSHDKDVTGSEYVPPQLVQSSVIPAISAFFKAIQHAKGSPIQDTLRLLNLALKYGYVNAVHQVTMEGVNVTNVDTWLSTIPQLIARLEAKSNYVKTLVQNILASLGKEHPQALVYPLAVAAKYPSAERREAAETVLGHMRRHSPELINQALTVSTELIRVTESWGEQWEFNLIEASRVWERDKNAAAMFEILDGLYATLDRGPETQMEAEFHQLYSRHLYKARDIYRHYLSTHDNNAIRKAWDAYIPILQRIQKDLKKMTRLEFERASPVLLKLRDLQLVVPGTYRNGKPNVYIQRFESGAEIIGSKHKPRKLHLWGSDNKRYTFLLKGHEDLRQDERVMQLFDLINPLLRKDPESSRRNLHVRKFTVVPLSPHSGLLQWVQNTNTMHALITEHRRLKRVNYALEHSLMINMAPEYNSLTIMQKMEVFEYAMINTRDASWDLASAFWLNSPNSETWFRTRCTFVRTLATMSMVGYILGLGDRHPLNILMDKVTGAVIHVDLGDCFEVATQREHFPERVPFRLTRMMENAMEISGTQGTFKIACRITMGLLREYKESIEAVMEAFLHDPLINWRLVAPPREVAAPPESRDDLFSPGRPIRYPTRSKVEQSLPEHADELNQRAVQVIDRINDKLTGRDFKPNELLSIKDQVDKLIAQATSPENLCQSFLGWCPFW